MVLDLTFFFNSCIYK